MTGAFNMPGKPDSLFFHGVIRQRNAVQHNCLCADDAIAAALKKRLCSDRGVYGQPHAACKAFQHVADGGGNAFPLMVFVDIEPV